MSFAPTGFVFRLILSVTLLLTFGALRADAYQVGAETEQNRIHIALTDYHHIGPIDSFKSELLSHPDWITITDKQIATGRVTDLIIDFNVGVVPVGTTGDLVVRIEALDQSAQIVRSAERTIYLTVAPAPPVEQHSFRIDECCIPVADVVTEPVLPDQYVLLGNHPNPFAASTDIRFGLPRAAVVSLRICDITGRCIDQISSGELAAGYHRINWTGRDAQGRFVTPGVYFYQLSTDEWSVSRKMLLLQ